MRPAKLNPAMPAIATRPSFIRVSSMPHRHATQMITAMAAMAAMVVAVSASRVDMGYAVGAGRIDMSCDTSSAAASATSGMVTATVTTF